MVAVEDLPPNAGTRARPKDAPVAGSAAFPAPPAAGGFIRHCWADIVDPFLVRKVALDNVANQIRQFAGIDDPFQELGCSA